MPKKSPNIHDNGKVAAFSELATDIHHARDLQDVDLKLDGEDGEQILDAIRADEFPIDVQLSEAHRLLVFGSEDVSLRPGSFILRGVLLQGERTAQLEVQQRSLARKAIAGLRNDTAPFNATLRPLADYNQFAEQAYNN